MGALPTKRGLPKGCTVDDVISFPVEAAAWLGQTVDWTRKHEDELPVIHESNKVKLFHPRSYIEMRLPKFKRP